MNRIIKKVAILGSGVMGSRIACHFAGIGVQTLLLDITPTTLNEAETAKKLTLEHPAVRNRIVNEALAAAIKSNPSPVYTKDVAGRITTGNFTDNLKDIAGCDWVIEVVVERLDIKQQLFTEVEKHRKPGTLITSNTSGIPIHLMAEGRSDDFKKHFCGTHFFNPPRYLRLLEIIPTPFTDPEVVDFLMYYGDLFLGKTTVLCKDTPAFIANRIGVYGIMSLFRLVDKMGLSIDEVDSLTGPIIGRPKSATFRTADVVGIDTLVKVEKGVYDNCPNDEARDVFVIPAWLERMVRENWLGDKTGQGFFKKIKLPVTQGSPEERKTDKEITVLDLSTFQYIPRSKAKFVSVEAAKPIDGLSQRLKMLFDAPDKAGEFYRAFHFGLFSYVSHRIPEISDDIYRVDDAMMAGFGWEIGPFESWDILDVEKTVNQMTGAGHKVAGWVNDMLAAGFKSFYKIEAGKKMYYDPSTRSYKPLPGADAFIIMSNYDDKLI